jgi:hypothetical protein
MVVPWVHQMRACMIEEMLAFDTDPEPTDENKLKVVNNLIDFFPLRPTPRWWSNYVIWFRASGHTSSTEAWTRLISLIQDYDDILETQMAELQMDEGEGESDYEENDDRLGDLPEFFVEKFERISVRIVVNEWMLHKQDRSSYSPALIIRVALYQMETADDTEGTFLDLLNQYVRRTV